MHPALLFCSTPILFLSVFEIVHLSRLHLLVFLIGWLEMVCQIREGHVRGFGPLDPWGYPRGGFMNVKESSV